MCLSLIVCNFNDLVVLGLGGVKYVKFVFLVCLGVDVVNKVRDFGKKVINIEVINVIEVFVCYLVYSVINWEVNDWLCGRIKLSN